MVHLLHNGMSRYRYMYRRSKTGRFRAIWGKMATKSKLEQAVEQQASNLNDAQRELVMSQFSAYKSNRSRIIQIEETLRLMDVQPVAGPDGTRIHLAQRMALSNERNQLVETNSTIASKLFSQLGDKE